MPIRDATGLDLAAIDEIYNHFVLTSTATFQIEPTTAGERRRWFEEHGPEHPVVVFEEDDPPSSGGKTGVARVAGGRVTGWASLNRYRQREAYRRTVEHSVYVRHDQHGRGVGGQLLTELIARATTLGHHVMLAHVASDQAPSLALHRRLGFADAGRIREVGFKFGRWVDVSILDLVLPAPPGPKLT
ncbi:MAG: pta [Labilithrix sp.]|nr:pta [Labilithrix sp.]